MRVLCTGISGTQRLSLLQEVAELAGQVGHPLQIFDVRDVMFQIAQDVGEPVEEETVLDMFPPALVLLRAAALEKISSGDQGDRSRNWIINTHAVFRWRNTLISGFDPFYLRRLKPDLYVTVTDGVLTVRDRLRRFPRWEQATAEELLVWREEEQWATEEMARIHHKPQYLFPRRMSARTLVRLMFEPKVKTAYLSYPMQHVEPGAERGLVAFKRRLEEGLVVFDPADVDDFATGDGSAERSDGTVELAAALTASSPMPGVDGGADSSGAPAPGSGSSDSDDPNPDDRGAAFSPRELRHVSDQIVFRDYKLIAQSDMVIVFYDALVPSPGVISEMNYALQTGKRVYGVWLPASEPSPFFTRYCTRCFRAEDELFRYFERYRIAGRRTRSQEPRGDKGPHDNVGARSQEMEHSSSS